MVCFGIFNRCYETLLEDLSNKHFVNTISSQSFVFGELIDKMRKEGETATPINHNNLRNELIKSIAEDMYNQITEMKKEIIFLQDELKSKNCIIDRLLSQLDHKLSNNTVNKTELVQKQSLLISDPQYIDKYKNVTDRKKSRQVNSILDTYGLTVQEILVIQNQNTISELSIIHNESSCEPETITNLGNCDADDERSTGLNATINDGRTKVSENLLNVSGDAELFSVTASNPDFSSFSVNNDSS